MSSEREKVIIAGLREISVALEDIANSFENGSRDEDYVLTDTEEEINNLLKLWLILDQ